MSLVTQYEWLKDWSSVMKKAHILTSEQARFFTRTFLHALKEKKNDSLFSRWHTQAHTCNHRQTVFQEVIRTAFLLQTFCFSPARGHNPEHLRFMPIRVHCLRSVTDLVPQVRHPHCSASLAALSSWLTDENCHNDGWDGVKWFFFRKSHLSRNRHIDINADI